MNEIDKKAIIDKTFNSISIETLNKLICEYENPGNDFVKKTCLLKNILIFKSEGQSFIRLATQRSYAPNNIFFRVRKDNGIWDELSTKDFWEPPVSAITEGRLNRPREQSLYAANTPIVARAETKIDSLNPEKHLLIAYKSHTDINLTEIGFLNCDISPEYNDHSEKIKIIENFLSSCFSSKLSDDFVYEMSRFLGDTLDFSPDGWCYPSVASPEGECFCFRPSVKKKMNLISAWRFKEDGSLNKLFVQETDQIKTYDDFSTENSCGNMKSKEIDECLKSKPSTDDLQSENRSTESKIVLKLASNI